MNLKGAVYIFGFVLLVAVGGVYQGHLTQTISPLVFIFFASSMAMLTFAIICYLNNGYSFIRKASNHKINLFFLNIANFMVWFFYMYSLKYIEPAIAVTIANASGPLLIVLFSKYLRPNSRIFSLEIMAAFGIFLSLAFILYHIICGESALKYIDSYDMWLGIVSAFLTGIGQVIFSIYSKKLGENVFSPGDDKSSPAKHSFLPSEILAWRFPLIVVVSFFLLDKSQLVTLFSNANMSLNIFALAIFGMIIPTFFFQKGLKLTEPIFVAILIISEPVIMFIAQIFDPRLKISLYSYVGVAFISLFSIMSILGRYHQSKQTN